MTPISCPARQFLVQSLSYSSNPKYLFIPDPAKILFVSTIQSVVAQHEFVRLRHDGEGVAMVQYFFGRWCDLPYDLRNVTESSISDTDDWP